MKTIQKILFYFEMRSFGVSQWLADKFAIRAERVRLFFIYGIFASGLSLTVLLYLVMLFFIRIRNHFKYKRRSVFDL